jgi:hypothetical protein
VNDAVLKTAQSGNEMIEMELIVSDKNGEAITVIDRLVFSEKSYWKIDQFRISSGEKLESDQSCMFESDDCIDRQGWLTLGVDEYEGRRKNVVTGYIDSALLDPKVYPPPGSKAAPAQRPDSLTGSLNFGKVPEGS